MPYRFEFATFLIYATKRKDQNSILSIQIAGLLKNASPRVLNHLALKLTENSNFSSKFFTDSTLLVPVPRSSITNADYLWPSLEICKTLVKKGFGSSYSPLIKRTTLVRKSSTAAPGNRPTWQEHYKSLSVENILIEEDTIVLVDDVFTKGNTTVGCAIKLQKIYPDKKIKIFAVMRTRGFIDSLPNIISPNIQFLDVDHFKRIILPD